MKRAIDETQRRRVIQEVFNRENGITPQTIIKPIEATLITASEADYFKMPTEVDQIEDYSPAKIEATITRLEVEMRGAAKRFEFEKAAELRDRIKVLRERELQLI
jgi:excinuclease ABC subunit B